jgi:hypothetical protein
MVVEVADQEKLALISTVQHLEVLVQNMVGRLTHQEEQIRDLQEI